MLSVLFCVMIAALLEGSPTLGPGVVAPIDAVVAWYILCH